MARVQYGSLITELKGSIGGTTFQVNSSGNVAKNKVNRVQGGYPYQIAPKFNFSYISDYWNALSVEIKSEWNAFAAAQEIIDRWGTGKFLTGYQLFLSLQSNLLLIDQPLLVSPPIFSSSVAVPVFSVTLSYTEISVTFDPSFDHTGYSLLIFASPVSRSLSLANRKSIRLVSYISSGISETIDITAAWSAYFQSEWPLPGLTESCGMLISICSVSESKGIASAFTSVFGSVTL